MTKQRKIIFIILSLTILFSAGARRASACSCAGRFNDANFQPCNSYWTAEAVFVGSAEKISFDEYGMKVSFAVEKSVRGVGGKTIDIYTSASTASCGYPFKEGERYFVYARRGQDGRLTERLCGSTVSLKNAAEDFEYAEEIESGKNGARLFGGAYELKRESYKVLESHVPLASVEITIKGKKNKFKTQTDEKGFYNFKNIPADTYLVTARFPENLREPSYRGAKQPARSVIIGDGKNGGWARCESENFSVTSLGSIQGKIVGYDGRKPPQQFVSLLPIDDGGKAVSRQLPMLPVWTDKMSGEFIFNYVPAGNYLLSINPNNCPFQTTPETPRQTNLEFGKMFFPGVAKESEAKIISLKKFEQLRVGNFQIMPPLKERRFSGVVLSGDKTPLAGATVYLSVRELNECFILERLAEVKTDERGRFELKGYESYFYRIRAFAETKTQAGKILRLLSKNLEIASEGDLKNIKLTVDSPY